MNDSASHLQISTTETHPTQTNNTEPSPLQKLTHACYGDGAKMSDKIRKHEET